jgi:phosphatidylglycerol lysyltransferase
MNIIKKIEIFILKHYKGILKSVFASALILLILFEGKSQFESIHLASTLHMIRLIPLKWIILFLFLGIAASFSMVLYDIFGMKAFQYDIEKGDLLSISFVSNSLNTLLGLGGLTGASVKSLLLKKRNIELKEMISYNTLLVTSATTGLSFFAILTLFNYRNVSSLLNQHIWLWACLIGYSLYLVIYFFLERLIKKFKNWSITFGSSKLLKLRIKLLAVSILEWALAGILFYTLASYFHQDLIFMNIMSLFVIASIAGILSFLPGGAGSFDLIAIIGLQLAGLSPNVSLSVVILYRIFYYFVPSLTAITIFSLQALRKTEEKGSIIKSNAYGQFVAALMAIIVFTCGTVLLISALTPSLISRSRLITDVASVTFLQYSRSISIAIGLMLLITSKEIFFRVKRAYHVVMVLLFAGGIFTFIKGFDVEEFIFILVCMGIIRLSKTNFYRKSIPLKLSSLIAQAIGVFILLIGYLRVSHFLFSTFIKKFHYPHLVFMDINTFIHSGVIAYTLFVVFIIAWYVKRENIDEDSRFQGVDEEMLQQFWEKYKGHHLSHLIHLGDKKLFWAADSQVLIAYAKYSDKAIVLGDPMGEESLISEGIQEFQMFLDLYGYRAAFYEVDEKNLSMYHDNGYYFFKLGEEAIVDLQSFEMTGSNRRSFRNTLKRFEKDGFVFEVVQPPFDDAFLDELELISQEWLGKRNEMGFSIGWFNRSYLQKAPIAIVKNISSNEIIAFVSLMYRDPQKDIIGIDLMRFKDVVPNSTMDFIFTQLLVHFKENGYNHFSFGLAPLAKVGSAPKSHWTEKIAHFVSKHGKLIYSFEGLRKFKDKFDPDWEPRYLAYPQLMSLPALLIEISLLVNKTKKKNI